MNNMMLKKFYYLMKLGREFELRSKQEYMKGNIAGFLHLDIGQEAISIGSMLAFEKGDVFAHYREHVLAIARGIEPKYVMAELFGKKTGVSGGKGGSMHLFEPKLGFYGGDAIVGGHLPLAVGCAYARKLQGEKAGVFAIFGTHITWTSPFLEQHNKVKNYMPTMLIDGMDVIEVYNAVIKAKEHIENGLGPIFIEAMTYRYEGHSISDAGKYRSEEELNIYKSKDPIKKLKEYAINEKSIDEAWFEESDKKIAKEIEEAVEFALNSPEPDDSELFDDIFCENCEV
jgi:pyruvate dehydrogenase E1 component alpha subunit